MFVRRKNYEIVMSRYELAASRADRAEKTLEQLHDMALKNGGLYRCIIECREAAMDVNQPGRESTELTMQRLAFIDRLLSELLPLLTERMEESEKQMWNDALESRTATMDYAAAHALSGKDAL